MLEPGPSYEALVADFRWRIPERYNIGVACADSWAAREPERVALIRYDASGNLTPITYGELKRSSDRLALAMRRRGVGAGDRVALLLPQSIEAVLGHLAAYKLGAIAVPLAALFGEDALRYRLANSGAALLVADATGAAKVEAIRADLPDLATILCTDGPARGVEGLQAAMEGNDEPLSPADTGPDDPALMIFTSGTTGPPKGALHAHRVLLGHLPGIRFSHEGLPQPEDRLWTPSDWAWAGGLLNCLLPGLALGVPVVFGPFRPFDPKEALTLMANADVRNAFLPPTAVRMLRAVANPRARFDLKLRTIGSAGESLGRETWEWARSELGIAVNEFYGQTECNYVLASCAALGVSRPGAIGKPVPGHEVRVIDADGRTAAPGSLGEIAIRRPDPAMFLGYWRDAPATEAKFCGDWMLTGDRATVDSDGYVSFVGRNDDIITSSGYRIGPTEIEDCLATHPAVAMAAAVGKPDVLRTEIVKAFVVLKPHVAASPQLADEIGLHVRKRLSSAEYPREIAFVDEIPLTTSGKVIRRHFRELAKREAG
ncbi:MAG: AMP-binding protein [Dongiaceae bacterium]